MDSTVLIGSMAAVLAALGGVVKIVLDFQRSSEERHIEANAKLEERFEKFIGQHLERNTRAQERVADRLAALEVEHNRRMP